MAAPDPAPSSVEVVRQVVTRTHWYPEHTTEFFSNGLEVRTYGEWGPFTLLLDRQDLQYTYNTASGETKEEGVFELDAQGKPWTIAGVSGTQGAVQTENNKKRLRALQGLSDALNNALAKSQIAGGGASSQVRRRGADPRPRPYTRDMPGRSSHLPLCSRESCTPRRCRECPPRGSARVERGSRSCLLLPASGTPPLFIRYPGRPVWRDLLLDPVTVRCLRGGVVSVCAGACPLAGVQWGQNSGRAG